MDPYTFFDVVQLENEVVIICEDCAIRITPIPSGGTEVLFTIPSDHELQERGTLVHPHETMRSYFVVPTAPQE